ncbi:MAG: acetyl-CoA carboxylase, biotin carboxyl carrier protein, partial [Proteobacteria bacterium]|nr:acetyl-CoA carboxylase, biotin carboxyl carrier protein [Pseudomonadota bacterium]
MVSAKDAKGKSMKDAKARIKELSKLLGENNLSEIEMEQDGLRIRVSRAGGAVLTPAAGTAGGAPREAESEPGKPAKYDPRDHPGCLKSPMVGTVFIAPEPGADAFVSVGDTVKKGQTLFIIE